MNSQCSLISAVKNSDVNRVSELLLSANLNACDKRNHTAFHYAFEAKNDKIAQLLYDNGCGLCPMAMLPPSPFDEEERCKICRDGIAEIIEGRREQRSDRERMKFKALWVKPSSSGSKSSSSRPKTTHTLPFTDVVKKGEARCESKTIAAHKPDTLPASLVVVNHKIGSEEEEFDVEWSFDDVLEETRRQMEQYELLLQLLKDSKQSKAKENNNIGDDLKSPSVVDESSKGGDDERKSDCGDGDAMPSFA